MLRELEKFYFETDEPQASCLIALRDIILNYNKDFEHILKYRLPCFMFQNKIFCYIWIDRKTQFPYIAIGKGVEIEHPDLIQGNRTWVKKLMIDPEKDIPIKTIHKIFDMAMKLYAN